MDEKRDSCDAIKQNNLTFKLTFDRCNTVISAARLHYSDHFARPSISHVTRHKKTTACQDCRLTFKNEKSKY